MRRSARALIATEVAASVAGAESAAAARRDRRAQTGFKIVSEVYGDARLIDRGGELAGGAGKQEI